MHLGSGGGGAPQRFEYSFSAMANTNCFHYANMKNEPATGLHSMVGIIDMSRPFTMMAEFTYATPRMTVTYSQDGRGVVVYDSSMGTGAEGSKTVDMNDLVTSMATGYWLELSFWQGYSPSGPGSSPWWTGSCSWGDLCNTNGAYWGISNISVTAEADLSR